MTRTRNRFVPEGVAYVNGKRAKVSPTTAEKKAAA
jgi:hypothetical protein